MTDSQLRDQAVAHLRRMTVPWKTWEANVQAGKYANPGATEGGKAKALLDQIGAPAPTPKPTSPFGTAADAGAFAGRGIMLGGNPDVWDQAATLAKDEYVDVVAIPSAVFNAASAKFKGLNIHVLEWCPPEHNYPHADIYQAEKQSEWDAMLPDLMTAAGARAVVLNAWTYGRFPERTVALVEAYYNEGAGLNFEEYRNYIPQGACAVIPMCGGYSAAGRPDGEAARIYGELAVWSGGGFPGFWMFAGEDLLTAESVGVLKAWRPR